MKKYMLMTVAALLLSAPVAAWSQNASPATGSNEPQSQSNQGNPQSTMSFADRKADVLKHMNERLADEQKRIACVQAASDKDSMRACMPKRGDWGHQDGMHHGMGMKPADNGPGDMPPPDDNGPAK